MKTFYMLRKKETVKFTPVPEEKFSFAVFKFILFISKFSVGMPTRLDFRNKSDWSDLCVLLFVFSLLGTERRFVQNYRVFESISTMFLYYFDSIPPKYWYCGAGKETVDEKKKFRFGSLNFPKFLAHMIHDFYPGELDTKMMCWKPEPMGGVSRNPIFTKIQNMEHGLNIIHKLEMLPVSYRGNQVRRFLAYLYMVRCLAHDITDVNFPSIIDVANSSLLSSSYLKMLMHKEYSWFSEILVIVKLCDMIVGNDLIEDFSADKVPSILKAKKELLEKLNQKLPHQGGIKKTGNITILYQLRNHLQIVMQRWSSGCDGS
jgi:hypothetical protein